ncbi:MAG: TonB-dependent receptor [Haliea sp.]
MKSRVSRHKSRLFSNTVTCLGCALIPPLGLSFAGSVQAQTERAWAIEEVVVTARKKEESLQDMGQSVSALSASEIDRRFAADITQLADAAPNLIIDDTSQGPGGVAAIAIRGIGTADVEKSFDPAVGVVVDGIFLGTASGSVFKAIDIERMEVVRGPQGTLYGRNTIGGVINIQRSKPTGEFGGKVRGSIGNYERVALDGMLNFAVSDDLAVKVTGARHDQGKGYFKNVTKGGNEGEVLYEAWGAHLLYTPTDNLEINYLYNAERYDQDAPPILNISQPGELWCDAFGQCAQSPSLPQSGDRYETVQQGPNEATFDTDMHSVQVSWSLSEKIDVDYIFGSWKSEETSLQDFDGSTLPLFETSRPADYEQLSHELRITASDLGALSVTAGLYSWESEYEINLQSYIGFIAFPQVLTILQDAQQETSSWAGFFEADYQLTDKLILNFGARYTEDRKKAGIRDDFLDNLNNKQRADWSEVTPKIGVRYQVSDDLMAYATYTEGYRSGGFNGRPAGVIPSTTPFDPETVQNYEVGIKSEWLDNRLRVNLAAFMARYDDKQEEVNQPVSGATGQQSVVSNISEAESKGLELDVLYYPTQGLSVSLNLGYLDAEYNNFLADMNGDGVVTDNSFLDIRRAPDLTGNLGVTYEWDVADGLAWARIGYRYIGEHETSIFNTKPTRNSSQGLVDLSLSYERAGMQYSVYGRNLTEEDGYMISEVVGGVNGLWTYAAPRAPRTYGFEVSYSF